MKLEDCKIGQRVVLIGNRDKCEISAIDTKNPRPVLVKSVKALDSVGAWVCPAKLTEQR